MYGLPFHCQVMSCHISITQRQAKSCLCGEDISKMLNMKKYNCVLYQLRNAGKFLNDIRHYCKIRSFNVMVGIAAIFADPGCHWLRFTNLSSCTVVNYSLV
jgi:hypothetical protein